MSDVSDEAIEAAANVLMEVAPHIQSISQFEMTAAIEAYEAALWRPIESAHKGTRYILAWSHERQMAFQVNWTESVSATGHERQGWTIIGESSPAYIEFSHWRDTASLPKIVNVSKHIVTWERRPTHGQHGDEEEEALKQQSYGLGYEAALNDDCDYPYHGQNPYEEGCALEFLWSGGWEDAKLTNATCRAAADRED